VSSHSSLEDRLTRSYVSLKGLSCGDAFGERFFVKPDLATSLIAQRSLPAPPWTFTDDTMMAISIVSTLEQHGRIDQDYLAHNFARHYDSSRGYGPAMHELLHKFRSSGMGWRGEAQALFNGEGSFGNGSAMRVAPLGAFWADDIDAIPEQATLSATTTHTHSEAIAGAIAVAVASAIAWQSNAQSSRPEPTAFLTAIAQRTPTSAVKRGIDQAVTLSDTATVEEAVRALGNGRMVSAPDTVPFALWNAARHLESYEEALWSTVAGLGDRDTTCAIVGGIVVMYVGAAGIPSEWSTATEPIPTHMLNNYRDPKTT
jgi:ADP-ribosylglycohydrolase